MDRTIYVLCNLAWVFSKFFFYCIWVYATWCIVMGGEVKMNIGENGIRFGIEGIVPTIVKFMNLLK